MLPELGGVGAGGGCNTPAEIRRGAALSATGIAQDDPNGTPLTFLVLQVLGPGDQRATVEGPGSKRSRLGEPVAADAPAVAGLVPGTATVRARGLAVDLPAVARANTP